MTKNEMLCLYFIRIQCEAEREVDEIRHKYLLRRTSDELDCLEMIIALTRLNTIKEIADDVLSVTRLKQLTKTKA
ncbi:MAG: hypothetical protein E7507_01300 [Ruminococcus sp.]|nr:hypothetical protein [Ruminococcus sp.]